MLYLRTLGVCVICSLGPVILTNVLGHSVEVNVKPMFW